MSHAFHSLVAHVVPLNVERLLMPTHDPVTSLRFLENTTKYRYRAGSLALYLHHCRKSVPVVLLYMYPQQFKSSSLLIC